MKIETPRLIIRPWTVDDVSHYQAMSKDVGYNCFSPPGIYLVKNNDEATLKIKDRINLFEKSRIGKFLIFEKSSGDFVGTSGGDFFELDGKREVEIGYRLMLTHWGKGYATEAAQAVVDYFLNKLELSSVYGFALYQNQQSLKILEKVGFTYLKDFIWTNLPNKLYQKNRMQ